MMTRANPFLNLRMNEMQGGELAQREQRLARAEPFAAIDTRELRHLATMMDALALAATQWLCRGQGEEAREVLLVRSGRLEVFLGQAREVFLVRSGRLEVFLGQACDRIAELGPGELVGEYGLFFREHRTASVRALTDCELLALEHERFGRFLLAFPQASLALLRQAVARFPHLGPQTGVAGDSGPGTT